VGVFDGVTVPREGVEAKLNIASQAPAEHRTNVAKTRGLKNAACDGVFFLMGIWGCVTGRWTHVLGERPQF
jgi:hypothetical protein